MVPLHEVAGHVLGDQVQDLIAIEVGAMIKASVESIAAQPARWSRTIRLVDRGGWALPADREPFRRLPHSTPAELLSANNAVIDYLFYDGELAAAEAWATDPAPLKVALVTGAGGSGKSRFAHELTLRLSAHGWTCALLNDLDEETAHLLSVSPVPRLIVIDYAENRAAETDRLLKRLLSSSNSTAPVRVLLLSRQLATPSWASTAAALPESTDARVRALIASRLNLDVATRPLSMTERNTLYTTAVRCITQAWPSNEDRVHPFPEPDLNGSQYATALAVTYLALHHALTPNPRPALGEQNPADLVLTHEAKYWALSAPPQSTTEQHAQTIALASLFSGDKATDLIPHLEQIGEAPEAARALGKWASTYYSSNETTANPYIAPLHPDRLAERLIETALFADPTFNLEAHLDLATPRQAARAIEVLSRASDHSTEAQEQLTRTVRASLPQLAVKAVGQGHHLPAEGALAAALVDLLTGPLADFILESRP